MSLSWLVYANSVRVPEKIFYGNLLVWVHLEIEFEVYSLRTERVCVFLCTGNPTDCLFFWFIRCT